MARKAGSSKRPRKKKGPDTSGPAGVTVTDPKVARALREERTLEAASERLPKRKVSPKRRKRAWSGQ
jgi:hypothetical protein